MHENPLPRLLGDICGTNARFAWRTHFEGKGRFRYYLAPIPTWVIDAAVSPALIAA